MGWTMVNGIKVLLADGADVSDYDGLVGLATAEMIQFRATWGDDEVFAIKRTGNQYELQRINGEDVVIMGPVPTPKPEEPKAPEMVEAAGAQPIPAFVLWDEDSPSYNTFIGWYTSLNMAWEEPVFFFPRDDDRLYMRWNFDDAPGGQYPTPPDDLFHREYSWNVGSTEETSVYLLPMISTGDVGWDYPIADPSSNEYEQVETYGFNDETTHPLDYIFDVVEGDWQLTVYSASYSWVRDNNTGISYKLLMHSTCMRTPAIAIEQDVYTYHHWMSVKIEGDISGKIWPPDGVQVWNRRTTSSSTDGITMPGYGTIVSGASYSTGLTQSVGDHNTCASHTSIENHTVENIPVLDACVYVKDVEGYDNDTTWMVHYHTWEYEETDNRYCDPWIHEPYHEDIGAPEHIWITQRYWVCVNGPSGYFEFEYAPLCYGTTWEEGDYDEVTPYEPYIFDFHGEPVYVFAWTDTRDNPSGYVSYGFIYLGKFIQSEEEYLGSYFRVGESVQLKAKATLRAAALGIEEARRGPPPGAENEE